jgi:hypothetical protein
VIRSLAPGEATTAPSSSTADLPLDPAAGTRGQWLRRAFLTLLAVVVAAGALGFLGVRSRSTTVRSGASGTTLSVRYAQVARAGLDVPFQITIRHARGFDGDVIVKVSADYLDLFDRNAIDPAPSSETADGRDVIWQFDPPPGKTLVISLDMEVQGGRHFGKSGHVVVDDATGDRLASATFTTHLAP